LTNIRYVNEPGVPSFKAEVNFEIAIKRLGTKANIQATPDMKIKEIAEKCGETPEDIWGMIQPDGEH